GWRWTRNRSIPTSTARTIGGRGSGPAAARRATDVGARVAWVGRESLAHRAWPGRERTYGATALDDAAGDRGVRCHRAAGGRAADPRHRPRRSATADAGVGGAANRRAGRRDTSRCPIGRPRVTRAPVRARVLLQRQPRRAAARPDHAPRVSARTPHDLPDPHGRARGPGGRAVHGAAPASRDPRGGGRRAVSAGRGGGPRLPRTTRLGRPPGGRGGERCPPRGGGRGRGAGTAA